MSVSEEEQSTGLSGEETGVGTVGSTKVTGTSRTGNEVGGCGSQDEAVMRGSGNEVETSGTTEYGKSCSIN